VNDLIENPTAEVMAVWIWNRLAGPLSGLVEIELFETRSCSVVYRGE
jgi:6-pyruvoyltetrahydropterin/6-carboxytetrahydropterin synthase